MIDATSERAHFSVRKSLNTEVVIPCPRVIVIVSGDDFWYARRELGVSLSPFGRASGTLSVTLASRANPRKILRRERDARDGTGLWTGSITTPRQIFQQSNFISLKPLLSPISPSSLFLPLTQDIHRTVVSPSASSNSRRYSQDTRCRPFGEA